MSDQQDNLRTRIIAAIESNYDEAAPSLSMVDVADAVIRELGLRQETGDYDGFFGRRTRHRYVTEWIADE